MARFTRDQYRDYLEENGVLQVMADTLAKLYDMEEKPTNPLQFIRENLYTPEEFAKMAEKDPEIALAEGFADMIADEDCKMLLRQHLTKEIFDSLKAEKTSYESSLYDCVRSGFENHDSGVGIYAPDPEAYAVFADIFDPIIDTYHRGFTKDDIHPAFEWGDPSVFTNLDPENQFVVSTRVRTARSVENYPFVPRLTENQYVEIMDQVKSILEEQEGEFAGKFYKLEGMEKDVQQQMIDDHFLFKEGDRFLQSAQACRFWPIGRGIFFNNNKDFLVWVNEEDHLRFISMEKTGDLGKIYQRLINGVTKIGESMQFSRSERLGWLSFCPTNLGTAIRASVHIKVPKLAEDMEKFNEIADKYHLQIRGTTGEHTEAVGGVYDISNKRRMGLTEFEAVTEMYNGIAEIIKMEKSL